VISALKQAGQVARQGFVKERPQHRRSPMIDHLAHGQCGAGIRRYRDALAHAVANIITRRIRRRWVDQTEEYLRSKNAADKPRQR
jgi:hypothetical protein